MLVVAARGGARWRSEGRGQVVGGGWWVVEREWGWHSQVHRHRHSAALCVPAGGTLGRSIANCDCSSLEFATQTRTTGCRHRALVAARIYYSGYELNIYIIADEYDMLL